MKKLILLLFLIIPSYVLAFDTNAKSAIVMDMDSKRILYAKDIHYTQSVASISKIMTAIITIENIDINKEVIIGDEILKAYGSGIYIKKDEKIKIKDLIYGLMLRSGNDSALALAFHTFGDIDYFVMEMNKKAKKLKMTNTTFNNPSGLDEKEEKGNFSSAYDMALLMSYTMKNEAFKKIVGTKKYKLKTNKNIYKWVNKNKLLHNYKYTTGGKTGYTKKAKRTLVTSASKNNLNLVVVTINDGNDFKEHENFYEEAFKNYTNYQILKKGKINIPLETRSNFYLKSNFTYPLLDSEKENIRLEYELLKNKESSGVVKVFLDNKLIGKRNIYVKKETFLDKIKGFFYDK